MRIAMLAAAILALSTTAFAQSLSGNQIRQTLVGGTISGVENGETYSERLNPNGTISGRSKSGAYSGRWRISGDEICLLEEGARQWDCNEVRVQGDKIIWDDNTTATLSRN
jgi:hypothetical protein